MKKYDSILDLMADKPYTMLIVGITAIYMGWIKIIPDVLIFYGINYVLIIMGIMYILFSILFTMMKIDDKKHGRDLNGRVNND